MMSFCIRHVFMHGVCICNIIMYMFIFVVWCSFMRVAAALLKANQEENEGLKKAQRRWTYIKPDFATRGIYGVMFHRGPIDGRHIQHNAALSSNSAFPPENCHRLTLQEQARGEN